MFQLLICLCAIGLGFFGCKKQSDSRETTTSAVETRVPDATTYNPFSSGIGARNSTLPELGDAKACDSLHFLIAGYCVKLANFNVFKSGADEFYAIGSSCEATPSSCGVPQGYKFSEVRFKVLVEPQPQIAEFLPPLEGIQKGNQIIFTMSPLEAQSKVQHDSYNSLGIVAWLSPFPVQDGKQMVQFEKNETALYGLADLNVGEGFLASSLGFVIPK